MSSLRASRLRKSSRLSWSWCITYGQGFLFARPAPGFAHQQPEKAAAEANRIVTPTE